MSLVVVGSVALDTVSNKHGHIEEGLGGSAVYFSMAASFFTKVHLVGVVGKDFRQEFKKILRKQGVDLRGLETADGETFRWSGEYSHDLGTANTLETRLNVFQTFTPKLPSKYKHMPSLFLANIDPDLQLHVLSEMVKPSLIACDTMNFWIEGKKQALLEVLHKVHILFINEDEAMMLADKESLPQAAQFILKQGPHTVFIKRGGSGVQLYHKHKLFILPAVATTKAIDTTGAGDSFAGGCMGYLTSTKDWSWENLKRAAIAGTIMASFNIESFSIHRVRLLKKKEINQRWVEFTDQLQFQKDPLPFDEE